MNDNTHPSIEALKCYAIQPAADRQQALSLHLAQCLACRQQLDTLQLLADTDLDDRSFYDEELHQSIADYIDQRLSPEQTEAIEKQLQDNPLALKYALHYSRSRAAMDRELASQSMHKKQQGKTSNNLLQRLLSLFQVRTPVWLIMPLGAVTALVFSWLLIPVLQTPDAYQLLTYQDNSYMSFQPKYRPPGMGFFQNAQKQTQLYNQLQVQLLDDQHVQLSWPMVKGATIYTVKLDVFEQGKRRSLGKVSTNKTLAVFDTQAIDIKRRFEWTLSGETTDNQQFSVRGGFLIH